MALDVSDFSAIDAIAKDLQGQPIDVMINNAGIFGPKPKAENDLRQTFGHMDYDIWANILKTNTMAPLKMAEALIENLLLGTQKKIVTISSVVGSITEANSGLFSYPASKAAVNMAMKTLAQALLPKGVIVASLNPGWVKTEMGGTAAPIEIEDSIRSLRQLIATLTLENSGRFIDYDGRFIPW